MMGKVMRGRRNAALRRALLAAVTGIAAAVLLAPGARAQAVPGGMSLNYSQNANKPIDITAEVLEVDDKKKVATFKGSVSATQGDFNMKARELVVFYSAGGGGGKKVATAAQVSPNGVPGSAQVAAPAAPAGPLPGGGSGEITKIEATGDIILTTKDSQECRGDKAVYQVKEQLVTITGNVRLSKGADNVMTGDKMVVNLVDSTTRLDNIGGDFPGGSRSFSNRRPRIKRKRTGRSPSDLRAARACFA